MRKSSLAIILLGAGILSFASCKSHGSCPAYGNSSVKPMQSKSKNSIVTKFQEVTYKKS
jgi:hypothetical protein